MTCVYVEIPGSQLRGLTIGSVVSVTVKGTVRSMSENYRDENPELYRVEVEGEASLNPGTLDDAARVAFVRLSNAKGPVDFPIGQRELHAP
jgi:hypothetical protein